MVERSEVHTYWLVPIRCGVLVVDPGDEVGHKAMELCYVLPGGTGGVGDLCVERGGERRTNEDLRESSEGAKDFSS